MCRLTSGWCALLFLILTIAFPSSTRADSLSEVLLKQAPTVIKYLQQKKCKNVGVLKFGVQEGNGSASFDAGTLNVSLAQRLEIALVLANPHKEEDQIGIIRNASAVAARLPGADHLTTPGRKVLFQASYPLAWGNRQVTPDILLTGLATLSTDMKRLDVTIDACTPTAATEQVAKFSVANDLAAVVETGQSFLLRGVHDGTQSPTDAGAAFVVAARVKSKEEKFPLADEMCPFVLEVRYDGKVSPIEFRDGAAFVREPKEKEQVSLVLRRRGDSKAACAAVVKVNGENTLFRERLPDEECAKWLLGPEVKELTILGFHINTKKREDFRILSAAESKKVEARYGDRVGLITLSIFGERRTPAPLPSLEPNAENVTAIVRGVMPEESPKNMLALRAQLRDAAQRGVRTRGLFGSGTAADAELREEAFAVEPVPLLQVAVRYYSKP